MLSIKKSTRKFNFKKNLRLTNLKTQDDLNELKINVLNMIVAISELTVHVGHVQSWDLRSFEDSLCCVFCETFPLTEQRTLQNKYIFMNRYFFIRASKM